MLDAKTSPAAAPHLVLVGNGDAHRHVVANADRLTRAGARVTLVTRDDFWFRDWLGGMLGGEWQIDELRLPANRITARGGTHIAADVGEVDLAQRRLSLTDGSRLTYDWLSLDLPPIVDERVIPGFYTAQGIYGVSADQLWQLRQRLETQLAVETTQLPSIAVMGSGPLGVELAANLLALGERYGKQLPVALIGNDRQPLPGACQRANRWLTKRLYRRGLRLELVATATRYDRGQLILDDGSAVEADFLLVTDALRPPPSLSRLGLPVDDTDAEPVGIDVLRHHPEEPHLFVAQSMASDQTLSTRERGALLLDSLERAIGGEVQAQQSPHTLHWKALNLGDLRDIAWRGPLWCRGRWVRRLKHRRDRHDVAHYLDER